MQIETKRKAFVCGGSGAIGQAVCRGLAANGFTVAVGYNSHPDIARKLADELGGGSIAVKCDATNFRSVVAAREICQKELGEIDTLVNCVGTEAYRLLCDEDADSIKQTLDANLSSAINLSCVFSPAMVSVRFGRIVHISSVWGVCGAAMETVYSAAKAGVIGFTKALALELAPSQVTVNAVCPGFIDTPMNARFSEEERAAILDEIPACRFGEPCDVAAAVNFFVSDSASYITGQTLGVGGGYKA